MYADDRPGLFLRDADLRVLDKDVLRSELPIVYVCDLLGIQPDETGQACCPFHDDHRPSFYLYLDDRGVEKWACMPCGVGGDVYDLIQKAKGLTFSEALTWARDVLEHLPEGAARPKPAPKQPFDRAAAQQVVLASQQRARENIGWLCVSLGIRDGWEPRCDREDTDDWLRTTMGVGVGHEGEAVLPHFDSIGRLTGVKFRALDSTKWAFPGSQWTSLYGSWLTRRHRGILVCEGETDALWARMQNPPLDVYALPGGAGRFDPRWTDVDADVVVLGFDADAAGDAATATWTRALGTRDVRVCKLSRGVDLRSSGHTMDSILREAARYNPHT